MPLTARMSLWGLYQYDNTILDGLTVPTGMNGDNVKQNLLLETAGLSILYPDPDFLKAAITVWSSERQDVWDKMYATTVAQYNPMENYDRIEESNEENAGVEQTKNYQERNIDSESRGSGQQHSQNSQERNTDSESRGSGQQHSQNSQERNSETENHNSNQQQHTGENTATSSNTAYNSNNFADTAKNVSSGTDNLLNNTVSSESGSERTTDITDTTDSKINSESGSERMTGINDTTDSTINSESGKENISGTGNRSSNNQRKFSSRIHGNIGVRSGQELIMQSREIDVFCMTEFIINDFIQRFCVMVY